MGLPHAFILLEQTIIIHTLLSLTRVKMWRDAKDQSVAVSTLAAFFLLVTGEL